MAENDEKSVGYKRPPRRNQFRPGQSGNPSGRPKNARNFQTDLLEELNALTTVAENGRATTVSKQRAVIKTFLGAAMKGDVRAATALFSFCARMGSGDDDEGGTSKEERELLDGYVEREIERRKSLEVSRDRADPNGGETGDASDS